ncbi:MAG: hypothetical protein S4CHLAM45_06940 [Chlamydiales bacterium]|nr:hypothetical protein [Chlamydiales bacterium]MCH9620288.1 hypothetical protein [Chlamydiales bacterium]MCH9622801.1 hypothetical protein [Chlamydiales bacterium]
MYLPLRGPLPSTPQISQFIEEKRGQIASMTQAIAPAEFNVDRKLFAHLFLDGHIGLTSFQGINRYSAAKDFHTLAQILSESVSEIDLSPTLHLLETYKGVAKLFGERCKQTGMIKNRCSLEKIAKEVTRLVSSLQPGESIFLPGGFNADPVGHALGYLITRNIRGSFNFIVINTGDGTEFHSSRMENRKEKICPYLYFENIPEKLFFPKGEDDSFFFKMLFQREYKKQSSNYRSAVIYQGVFRPFWDYVKPLPKEKAHFMTPQRDGVCAVKVLLALLRYQLPILEYKKAHFYLRLIALNHLKPNISDTQMYLEGLEAFEREVLKKLDAGLISQAEATLAKTKIDELRRKFRRDIEFKSLKQELLFQHKKRHLIHRIKEIESGEEIAEIVEMLQKVEVKLEAELISEEEAACKRERLKKIICKIEKGNEGILPSLKKELAQLESDAVNQRDPTPLPQPTNCDQTAVLELFHRGSTQLKSEISVPKTQLDSFDSVALNKPDPQAEVLHTQLLSLQRETRKLKRGCALQTIVKFVAAIPLEETFWAQVSEPKQCYQQLFMLIEFFQEQSIGFDQKCSIEDLHTATSLNVHLFEMAKRSWPIFCRYAPLNPLKKFINDAYLQATEEADLKRLNALQLYFHRQIGKKEILDLTVIPSVHDATTSPAISFFKDVIGKHPALVEKARRQMAFRGSDYFCLSVSQTTKTAAYLLAHPNILREVDEALPIFQFYKASWALASFFDPSFKAKDLKVKPSVYKYIENFYRVSVEQKNDAVTGRFNRVKDPSKLSSLRPMKSSVSDALRNDPNLSKKRVDSSEEQSAREAESLCKYLQNSPSAEDAQKAICRLCSWSGAERGLQPMQLLEIYTAFPQLLEGRDFQNLFELQFFKTCYRDNEYYNDLPEQIASNPLLQEYASEFVRKGMTLFSDLQPNATPDYHGALFFYRFGLQLYKSVQLVESSYECILFEDMLEACSEKIELWIGRKETEGHDLYLLHLHRLEYLLLQKEVDRSKILSSWFIINQCSFDSSTLPYVLDRTVRSKMHVFLTELANDDELDWESLMNDVFKCLGLCRLNDEMKWNKERGTLTLQDESGKWKIDLYTCTILEEGQKIESNKPVISRDHFRYKQLFGEETYRFFSKNNVTTFDHPQGEITLFKEVKKSRCEVHVRRRKDGVVMQYIDPEIIVKYYKNYFSRTLLAGKFHHWIEVGSGCVVTTTKEDWNTSIATIDENGPILCENGCFVLKSERYVQELSHLDQKEYHRVEYAKGVDEQTFDLVSIKLPRCVSLEGRVLGFHAQEGSLRWNEDSRYFLEESRNQGFLESTSQYVTVYDPQSGKRKLIISTAEFLKSSLNAFDKKGRLEKPRQEGDHTELRTPQEGTRPYVIFDIVGKKVVPRTIEGTIHLAYIRLHERNYDEAYELLQNISMIDPLSKLGEELLLRIVKSPLKTPHCTPNSLSVAIKALSIFCDHCDKKNVNMQLDEKEFLKPFFILYHDYLGRLANITEKRRLSSSEEKKVALFLKRKKMLAIPPDVLARINYLEGKEQTTKTHPARVFFPSLFPTGGIIEKDCNVTSYSTSNIKPEDLFTKPLSSIDGNTFFWSAWQVATRGSEAEQTKLHYILLDELTGQLQPRGFEVSGNVKLTTASLKTLYYVLKMNNRATCRFPFPKIELIGTIRVKKTSFRREEKYNHADIIDLWRRELKVVFNTVEETEKGTYSSENDELTISGIKMRSPFAKDLTFSFEEMQIEREENPFRDAMTLMERGSPRVVEEIPLPTEIDKERYPKEYTDCILREFTAVAKDLKMGQKRLAETSHFEISADALIELQERLSNYAKDQKGEIKALETRLLTLANRESDDPKKALHQRMAVEGKVKQDLTLKDLKGLFLGGSSVAFREANDTLTQDDIAKLYQLIGRWSVASIHLERAEAALGDCAKISKLASMSGDQRGLRKFLCQRLGETLAQDVAKYKGEDASTYLIFTQMSGKFARDSQREDVKKLSAVGEPQCVLQRLMGYGKTSVIATIWAKKCAQKGKLPVFIVDNAQYASLCNSLNTTQMTYWGQKVFTMQYHREELSWQRLGWMKKELESGLSEGKLLIICPEMLQLLDLESFITAKEYIADYKCHKGDLSLRLSSLKSILAFFKEKSEGLIDESDTVLRSDFEVNLPLGDEAHISAQRVGITKKIFSLLCSDCLSVDGKTLKNIVGLEEGSQNHLTDKNWENIRPVVASHLAKVAKALNLHKRPDLHDAFSAFVCYNLKGHSQEKEFLTYLEQLSSSFDPVEKEACQLICLTKHLLHDLLPIFFKHSSGRNFGRWRDQGHVKKTPGKVIPYMAYDCPARTELGYHYEALVKHMITATQEGLEVVQVKLVVEKLCKIAQLQMNLRGETLEETAEAQLFKRLTGIDLFDMRNEEAFVKATRRINRSLESRLEFESETALLYATYHQSRLTSTNHSLTELLPVHGMTGTPWNMVGVKPELADHIFYDEGTIGTILHTILERKGKTQVYKMDSQGVEEHLEEVYAQHGEQFVSGIFDAGALYSKSGKTNKQIAETILRFMKRKGVKKNTVLFFYRGEGSAVANQYGALIWRNEETVFKKLADTSRAELEKVGITSEEEYLLFLPERQTTGTDVPLPLDAKALITLDSTMPTRHLTQTIMRLRKFVHGQRAHFVISKDYAKTIPTAVKEEQIDYLLQTTIINTAKKKADSIKRSYKQMMDEVVKKACRARILKRDLGLYRENIAKAMEVYSSSLFPETSDDLYQIFGGAEEMVETIKSLRNRAEGIKYHLEKAVEKVGNMYGFDRDLEKIGVELDAIVARAQRHIDHFQREQKEIFKAIEDVKFAATLNAEMHQDTQVEKEKEVEAEAELEQDLKLELEEYRKLEVRNLFAESTWFNGLKISKAPCSLAELKGRFPVFRRLSTTFDRFSNGPFNYGRFSSIFSSNIYVTNNFRLTTNKRLPIFHAARKPVQQILCFQNKDGTFDFLLISEFEANFFKTYLKERYRRGEMGNVWLTTLRGKLFVPNLGNPLPLDNPHLRCGLCELSLFQGAYTPIHELQLAEEALNWLESGATPNLRKAKRDFLLMRLETRGEDKALFHKSGLLSSDRALQNGGPTTVARAEEESADDVDLEWLHSLTTPQQIRKLKDRYVSYILPGQVKMVRARQVQFLHTAEQIAAIPTDLVDRITLESIKFITPLQVPYVKRIDCIHAIPQATLQAVEQDPKDDPGLAYVIAHLSPAQLKGVVNLKWTAFINFKRLHELDKTVIEQLDLKLFEGMPIDRLEEFDDTVLKRVSPAKFKQVSAVRVKKIKDVELIVKVEEVRLLDSQQVQRITDGSYLSRHLDILGDQYSLEQLLVAYRFDNNCQNAKERIQQSTDQTIVDLVQDSEVCLLNGQLVKDLPFAKYPFLSEKQIPFVKGDDVHLLINEQREFLTQEQIRTITTEEALNSLSVSQRKQVHPNLYYLLPEDERPLTPEAIEEMTTQNALAILNRSQIRHINADCAHRLREGMATHLTQKQVVGMKNPEAIAALSNRRAWWVRDQSLLTIPQKNYAKKQKVISVVLIIIGIVGGTAVIFGSMTLTGYINCSGGVAFVATGGSFVVIPSAIAVFRYNRYSREFDSNPTR